MNIVNRSYGRRNIQSNIRNNFDLYLTCCIPVVPFCLSAHMFLYLYEEYEKGLGGFGNVLALMSGALLLVCPAAFKYSLKAYIGQRSEEYSILLMLGITGRDFWKNLMAEYCPAFLLTVTAAALIGSALSNCLMMAVFHRADAGILSLSLKIAVSLTALFAAGMAGTLLILIIRQWKKNLMDYLEDISHGKEALHKFRLGYGVKILPAAACLLGSFYLLGNYTVGRMFVAALLHLAGVYFLFQVNGRLVRRMLGIGKKGYYRHLLRRNDFIYGYRINGNIIYAIYTANYIMVFLFGGLFASDFPQEAVYTAIKAVFAVVGLAVILEEQAFIMEKMILDLRKEKERYAVLSQLGMGWEEYRKLVESKMKGMVILPMMGASVMGAVFFLCDYVYQEDITTLGGMWSMVLLKYVCAVACFWAVQYCGYLFLRQRFFRKYDAAVKNGGLSAG